MNKVSTISVLLCILFLTICSQISLAHNFKKVTSGIDKDNEKLKTECNGIYNKIQVKSKAQKDNATLINFNIYQTLNLIDSIKIVLKTNSSNEADFTFPETLLCSGKTS